MVVTHSTNPALKSPLTAINIKLTVQFPPAKVRIPRVRPPRMTCAFTGSRMMTVSSLMRSVEAASIQYPFHPLFRNGPYISVVYSPPWQVISLPHATCIPRIHEYAPFARLSWGRASDLGGGEENRLDAGKVVLFSHSLHENATDHTSPPNQTYT